jgi:hypothetical protein
MSLEKNKRLIQLLLSKTKKGEIDWQESFQNAFQVSFKDNSVRIALDDTNDQNWVYTIFLLNASGEVADRFSDEELDLEDTGQVAGDWYSALKELYTLALRHSRGADKVLNSILDELDDDIPF